MSRFLSTCTVSNYCTTPSKSSTRSFFSSTSPMRAATETYLDIALLNTQSYKVSRYPVYYIPDSHRSHTSFRVRRCHKSSHLRQSYDRPEVPAFRPEEFIKFKKIQCSGIKCIFCKRYECRCKDDNDDFLNLSYNQQKQRKFKITKVVKEFKEEKRLDKTLSNASRQSARRFKEKNEISDMMKDLMHKLHIAKNKRFKQKIQYRNVAK